MSFSFGTPTSTVATSSFSFGANKPAFGAATPSFGGAAAPAFGATATPTFGAATPSFGAGTTGGFGATSAPQFGAGTPSFGSTTPAFGATTTTPAFGAPLSSVASTGLGTGGINFSSGTSLANTSLTGGLSFGAPTATSASTGLGGFGFGGTNTTPSLGFGLLGASTATTAGGLFGAKLSTTTTPAASVAPSLGLGGMVPTSGIANITATEKGAQEPPKQTKLPNEISITVDSFLEFVKKQKSLSSDVMRVSTKPFQKVARDAEEILRSVLALSSEVGRARAQSKRLRSSAASALAAAEKASRDLPGTELEGAVPPAYVMELISELEQQLITLRRQMDVAEKQLQAPPKLLTEQELTQGMRRIHESLVALAGRLQAVHSQVETQKEQYLNLSKYILKEPSNLFEKASDSSIDAILRDAEGGLKKSNLSANNPLQGSAVLSDPRAALGTIRQMAGPTPFSYLGSSLSPFPPETPGASWHQNQQQQTVVATPNISFGSTAATENSSGLQLQKPPGKRGKQ